MENFLVTGLKKNLGNKPLLMGILNITPDSFSDGGKFYNQNGIDLKKVTEMAAQMADEGADILDIGGESTGPGSQKVPLEEELKRVVPVVKELTIFFKKNSRIKRPQISIDTYKAEVAEQALEAGANIVNDVTALRGDPKMASIVAKYGVPVIIMYAKDQIAQTTKKKIQYQNVIKSIKKFLKERINYGISEGIKEEQFIIDPGMGAFVSGEAKYSLEILNRLEELKALKRPILIGASKKGFIGEILGTKNTALPVKERLEGSLACAATAIMNGASIIRAHDVQPTRRVIDMVYAIKTS